MIIPRQVRTWAKRPPPSFLTRSPAKKTVRAVLKVAKMDIDSNPVTPGRYGIMSIPTLSIFKQGKVMEQVVGVVDKPLLEKKIKSYL